MPDSNLTLICLTVICCVWLFCREFRYYVTARVQVCMLESQREPESHFMGFQPQAPAFVPDEGGEE